MAWRWGAICRKVGISQAIHFNWKKKYDGLLPTQPSYGLHRAVDDLPASYGRLDEQHFFAAAAGQLEAFLETQLSRMAESTPAGIAGRLAGMRCDYGASRPSAFFHLAASSI